MTEASSFFTFYPLSSALSCGSVYVLEKNTPRAVLYENNQVTSSILEINCSESENSVIKMWAN